MGNEKSKDEKIEIIKEEDKNYRNDYNEFLKDMKKIKAKEKEEEKKELEYRKKQKSKEKEFQKKSPKKM